MRNILLFFILFLFSGSAAYTQPASPDSIKTSEKAATETPPRKKSFSLTNFLIEAVFGEEPIEPDTRSEELRALETARQQMSRFIGFTLLWMPLMYLMMFLQWRKQVKFYKKTKATIEAYAHHRLKHAFMDIVEKNDLIRRLERSGIGPGQILAIEIIRTSMFKDGDWDEFTSAFTNAFPSYIETMEENFPNLRACDKRILMLAKWRLSSDLISQFMMTSTTSVEFAWKQIKHNYNLDEDLSIQEIADKIESTPIVEQVPSKRPKSFPAEKEYTMQP